jgi:hypothetical protein
MGICSYVGNVARLRILLKIAIDQKVSIEDVALVVI